MYSTISAWGAVSKIKTSRERETKRTWKKIKNSRKEYRQEDTIYLDFLSFDPSCDLSNIEAVRSHLVLALQILLTLAVLTGGAALCGSGLLQLD